MKGRIGGAARLRRTWIEAIGIGLPDLDQRIAQRRSGAVDDTAADGDTLAARTVLTERAGAEVRREYARDLGEIRRAADMDIGAGGLGPAVWDGVSLR
jgi:hypothetical protein